MKAIILAAGIGSRITSVTRGDPKCLITFGRRAILDYQIESLLQAGISEIVIVTGHRRERIVDHVNRLPDGTRSRIRLIENPRFEETNNIYSLWLARHLLKGHSFVCLNADVLYHPAILEPAVRQQDDISMIIDRELRPETMKVIIDGNRVVAMSKAIPYEQASGTYIGITAFSARISGSFFDSMRAVLAEGKVTVFFNVAVERLVEQGVKVGLTETGGLPWAEIDDPADLEFARREVYPRIRGTWAGAACGRPCLPRNVGVA